MEMDVSRGGAERMANNNPRPAPGRTLTWRPASLALATATAIATAIAAAAYSFCPGAGAQCLSQGWPRTGDQGPAAAGYGTSRMGMGYADRQFIVKMIPHHEGAIAMADLALSRARRPEIKALAQSIKASQTSENLQMRSWYRQWYGQEVPSWAPGSSWGWQNGRGMGGPMGMGGGMGMGGMGMQGMGMHGMGMGGTSLAALRQAPDFDRAFIEQMIPHHQMGVMMASMAQTNSQHPQLRQLQQAMVRAQSDEIQRMEQWYRNWYSAGR